MKSENAAIIARLIQAVMEIEKCPELTPLIPEVRTNIVFARPGARTPADVAAVEGRITVIAGKPKAAGPVRFGASDHLARLVIELRNYHPEIRSVVDFRWNEKIHSFINNWAKEHKKTVGVIDRSREPTDLIGKEKMSIPWKVKELLTTTAGAVPEIAYETRGWGKEPLFILIGSDPVLLAERLTTIARSYARYD